MPNPPTGNIAIPAIGVIADPKKVRIALIQGSQTVNAPATALSDALGVPAGGTTGQVLTKSTDGDYNSDWADAPGGEFSGPASAVDGNLVAFDGTTGKLGKDSGTAISDLMPKSGGGFNGGINFGSVATTGPTDLAAHISLYSTTAGFASNSSTVYYQAPTKHDFYSGSTFLGSISTDGVLVGASTTGGRPGAGKVNAVDYQINGAALSSTFSAIADLASTASGKGASLLGIEDSGGNFTATTVEGALTELASGAAPNYGAGNAALSVGAVGTYALLRYGANSSNRAAGYTVAGSSLSYVDAPGSSSLGANPSGTWRLHGQLFNTNGTASNIWLRIS